MTELTVNYNELTAAQFIELWKMVWGDVPTLEQTELARCFAFPSGMVKRLLPWRE